VIRVAIVTVSDSSFSGTREDVSGPALQDRVRQRGWEVQATRTVPDETEGLTRCLKELADSGSASVILTTGGTGIAARDVTPEATRLVIEREVPGIGEYMRSEGAKRTRRAVLSRGIAGTRGRTLIVNLPGSPLGAVESFEAVADLIPHITDLLEGRTEHKGH